MFGQREYEAISVSAGPSYNVIIGQVNLAEEKRIEQDGRKKSKQKWHLKQPLIMPEDDKRYEEYPPQTRETVEGVRKTLRQILLQKGTLANLFN